MFLTVLFYVLIAVIFVEILFFSIAAINFKNITRKPKKSNAAVSLIIYTKNQADLIKKQLPIFLKQEHENFEIVLINHASTDDSLNVIEKFQKQHSIIKLVNVKNNEAFWSSKKYALTLGVKAATHEQLVLSSIAFEPQSTAWLQYMTAASTKKPMVIGFTAHINSNYFYRCLNLLAIVKNYTLGKMGLYYRGTSANVSYSKKLFFSSNGFVQHMKVPFGETILFANEVSKKSNTTICLYKDSFVTPVQKPSFRKWFTEQTKNNLILRHCNTTAQIANGILFGCHFLFYLLATFLLFFNALDLEILIASLIVARFIAQFFCYGLVVKKIQDLKLLFAIPFFEVFLLVIQFFIFILILNSKRLHWN
mgnify:CR=1 FL=1